MYSPFDLSGRGAVVTGGNGGIGLGMARALLASGAIPVWMGQWWVHLPAAAIALYLLWHDERLMQPRGVR